MQLPKLLTNEKLKKGEFPFGRNKNMLALRYQDKREIYMLSTMHQLTLLMFVGQTDAKIT